MIINVPFTNVRYSIWKELEDDPGTACRIYGELNIYDGRVTNKRIAREIPKGAVVEKVAKEKKTFYVVGENLLEWLSENGTVPCKE